MRSCSMLATSMELIYFYGAKFLEKLQGLNVMSQLLTFATSKSDLVFNHLKL